MIVNFEENMKSSKRISDNILDMTNWLHDSKLTGAIKGDEISKIITLEGKLFSNLVKKGKKTEEDVESFETLIPANYKEASLLVKEQNTDALMQREIWNKSALPIEEYSKGLRRVG